jgi:Fe-Mn family superoxide dismutase
MRGWAILSIDSIDNRFHIIGSDLHDTGAVWLSYPILVMDLYEHAYFMDFGTNKEKYISTFVKNINWNILNDRFKKYVFSMQAMNMNRNNYSPFEFRNSSFI